MLEIYLKFIHIIWSDKMYKETLPHTWRKASQCSMYCSPNVEYFQSTLAGCYKHPSAEFQFWTAGQRIDPSRKSTFVWRVTSTNTYSDTVSPMTYTNWYTDRPNYSGLGQSCMFFWSAHSYTWNDGRCSFVMCSVCELDIWCMQINTCYINWLYCKVYCISNIVDMFGIN